jgi:glycosyltransferase involved in cell wall biosynthesis
LELLVRRLLPYLNASSGVEVVPAPFPSRGLIKRLANAAHARLQRADVHHVFGDTYYSVLTLPRRRSVVTVHDCAFLHRTSGIKRLVLKLFWLTLPTLHAGLITTISVKSKQEILTHVPSVDPSKIIVIPCCLSEAYFFREARPFPAIPTILQVGTRPNKNLERVIAAIRGRRCHLDIIGKVTPEQERLLMEAGVSYEVSWDLSDDQVLQKYVSADIVSFVSVYEGFGMPIIEAQAIGRPVITSSIAPMCDVAGPDACCVDPFDVDAISAAVEKICSSQEYRSRLIGSGLANARRFTAQVVAEQYMAIYRALRAGMLYTGLNETTPARVGDPRT